MARLRGPAECAAFKKYRVSLEVDTEHVKRFDLTFDAEDEQDAEAQALIEVKQNLHDYVTVCADEEDV